MDAACNTAEPLTLSGGAPTGGTYSGAGVSGGIFDPSVAGVGSHLITYTFTDGNGCQNSAAQTILVEDCVNLQEQEQEVFAVYPNPATNELNIVGLNSDIQSVVMIDATGRVVLSNTNVINTNEILLNVSMLSNGVYTVSIYSENKAQHTRVVINK